MGDAETDDRKHFATKVSKEIARQGADSVLAARSHEWITASQSHGYSYHFNWLGLPIIQYPPDIVAVQELIWELKPDLVIETGVARGGSLLLSASILALLELAEAREAGTVVDPAVPRRRVLGIDIDIRAHNREAIEQHPLADRITMIEGSSVDPTIVEQVRAAAAGYERVMVMLDSNHTHDHVLAELEAYAPLVSPGSYCIVFDTIIEDMPADTYPDRPWGPGDNPKTAARHFLAEHPEFAADTSIDDKLLISVARDGYLRRLIAPR
jgi:cephalosporin hydroxylase